MAAAVPGEEGVKVNLVRVRAGQDPAAVLDAPEGVIALGFSGDSQRLLAATAKRLLVWNVATRQAEAGPVAWPDAVQAATFTPRGDRVFFSTWQTTELRDVLTGASFGRPLHHSGVPRLLASDGVGTQVAIGSDDRTARLWDPFRGVPLGRPVSHGGSVDLLALSPDGRVMLTCTEGTQVQLFSPILGVSLGPVLPQTRPVTSAAFSPDGRTLLLCANEASVLALPVPEPLDGPVGRVLLTVEVLTGLTLDQGGVLHALDADSWQQRRHRLQGLGGPLLP